MTRPKFEIADFRKAHRSDPPDKSCVHCARGFGVVVVRDTKQEFGSSTDHQMVFTGQQFDEFQATIRAAGLRTAEIPTGVFDGLALTIERQDTDVNVLRSNVPQEDLAVDAVLVYTDKEIVAFLDGVHNDEFAEDTVHAAHTAECSTNCTKRELAIAA